MAPLAGGRGSTDLEAPRVLGCGQIEHSLPPFRWRRADELGAVELIRGGDLGAMNNGIGAAAAANTPTQTAVRRIARMHRRTRKDVRWTLTRAAAVWTLLIARTRTPRSSEFQRAFPHVASAPRMPLARRLLSP